MALGKKLLRTDAGRRALCWIIHLYIRFVYATNRWTTEGRPIAERFRVERTPFITVFWHGRMLMLPYVARFVAPMRAHVLISGHRDGRLIAEAIRYLGLECIAGSSNQGGASALRAMMRIVKAGDCIAITPDGPNGPAMRASAGIVGAARVTRTPIIPIAYATSRRRILGSWDRFHLPLPFGRGVFLVGEPISVPAELDEAGTEALRRQIEDRLTLLTAEADRRVGRAPIAPGTLGREALRAMRRAAPGERS